MKKFSFKLQVPERKKQRRDTIRFELKQMLEPRMASEIASCDCKLNKTVE